MPVPNKLRRPLKESASFNDTYYDDVYHVGFAVGYLLPSQWRIESEISVIENKVKQFEIDNIYRPTTGHLTVIPLLINTYYDFKIPSTNLAPCLGVGIGGARLHKEVLQNEGSGIVHRADTVFAYQFSAGINSFLNKNLQFGVMYHYLATAKNTFSIGDNMGALGTVTSHYQTHLLGLKLSYLLLR